MCRQYAKLKGEIRAKYGTQSSFASDMSLSTSTLSLKLNGLSEWTRTEIVQACDLLGIPLTDAHLYFFSV